MVVVVAVPVVAAAAGDDHIADAVAAAAGSGVLVVYSGRELMNLVLQRGVGNRKVSHCPVLYFGVRVQVSSGEYCL